MSPRQPGPYDSVARKWLALAERRRAHFGELSSTGRWRHYFTAAELEQEVRKADALCAGWAGNIGLVVEDDGPVAFMLPAGLAIAGPRFEWPAGLDSGFGAEASHRVLREALGRWPA
jgi:hypothetical protein